MLRQHVERGADVTVACLEVPRMEAIGLRRHARRRQRPGHRLPREAEGPARHARQARHGAGQHGHLRLRDADFLFDQLQRDAADPHSSHDFGKDIIPYLVKHGNAHGAPLRPAPACASTDEAEAYWRDVGTVDAYWEANIDLTDVVPELDLYDQDWPIWTYAEITPPAKFVHDEDGRRGMAMSSLVSGGCIISGAALAARSCSPASTSTPSPSWTSGGAALRRDRPRRQAEEGGDRPRGADSRGPGGRRGPRARRPALPPHRQAASAWSPSR